LFFYYITDRTQFPGGERQRRQALLKKIAEATRAGVDLIQLREKDLSTRELEGLVLDTVRSNSAVVQGEQRATRLLINSRSDVAIACGADGVHLRSSDIAADEVCKIWARVERLDRPVIAVSCHTREDVARAAAEEADYAVLAPIFEKQGKRGAGIEALRAACGQSIPVIALGGVTLENAADCVKAGAAGVAGIRLFQQNDIAGVVRRLRPV
jgi:thiamine-phosphate pyrophosphorylase